MNAVISKRFAKRQQMQWTPRGAHLLLQTRTRTLDGTLRPLFERWYPGLANDNVADAEHAARPPTDFYAPIAKELKAVTARLGALEQMPALATTPTKQAAGLRLEIEKAGEEVRRGLGHSQAQLDGAVRALHGMIGSAREWRDQKQWLCAVGGIGVMFEVLLWFMLPAVLPWGAGDWLSALPIGRRWAVAGRREPDAAGGPGSLGADGAARPGACPPDRATASCEAAMAARTVSPRPDRRSPNRHARAK